jgi:hypothetical protein
VSSAGASGCLVESPLKALEWELAPGSPGTLTAEFQTDGPTFIGTVEFGAE